MKRIACLATLTLSIALAGCTVGPDYVAPDVRVPKTFPVATRPAAGPPAQVVDLKRWWESFHDPVLNLLIDRAVASNLDVQLAEARIREARAQWASVRAGLFPTVDADAAFTRRRNSKTTLFFPPVQTNLYTAGFDAAWEADIFGGTRRAVESARANLESQVEAQRNVTLTLLAEVAQNYIMVRGYQHELAIVRQNVASQEQTLDVTRAQLQAGNATELNIAQAEAQLTATQAQIPPLSNEIEQAIYRLGVLMDLDPNALFRELQSPGKLPTGPPVIPPGLPSDLLRRRPDVRQAERQLAVATANIGVETAQLFPQFSLTGTYGLESLELRTLADSRSVFWTFGPAVSWRIFDAGQIKADIRITDARQQEALIQYRQAVLQSLQDVQTTLVAYSHEQDRHTSLQKSVSANLRSVDLAIRLNKAGLVDFLNVLTAQQSLFQSQDQLAQSDQAVSIDLVAVYKALGGGWESFEPNPPPPPVPATNPTAIPSN